MADRGISGQAAPASIADERMPSPPSTQNPPSEKRSADPAVRPPLLGCGFSSAPFHFVGVKERVCRSVLIGLAGVAAALWGDPVKCSVRVEGHRMVGVFSVVVMDTIAFYLGGVGLALRPRDGVVQLLKGAGAAGSGTDATGTDLREFLDAGGGPVLLGAQRLGAAIRAQQQAAPGAVHGQLTSGVGGERPVAV